MKSEENATVCNSMEWGWFRYAMTFYYDVYCTRISQEKNCTIIISDNRYINMDRKCELTCDYLFNLSRLHMILLFTSIPSPYLWIVLLTFIIAVQGSMYLFSKRLVASDDNRSRRYLRCIWISVQKKDSTWRFWSNFLPLEEFLTPTIEASQRFIPTNIKSMTQATYLDNWYMYFLVPLTI